MTEIDDAKRETRKALRPLLLVFVVLTAVISLTALRTMRTREKEQLRQQSEQLQAIAGLKVQQIRSWLLERLGDANLISHNPLIVDALAPLLSGRPRTLPESGLRAWMDMLLRHYHYSNVLLLDRRGEVLRAALPKGNEVGREARELMERVRRTREPAASDLHANPQVNDIHIDIAAPLDSTDGVMGFVLLRIDPQTFLYPLIQSWPTPSPSAETLLVRREGGDVLFLNELRHRRGKAMKMRFPLTRKDLPAALAVKGYSGVVVGRDYRGIPVWSVVAAIPGTTWFIVAKVDEEEILTPLRREIKAAWMITLSLIAASGALLLLLWQRQARRITERRLEAEIRHQALEQHYQYLTRNANDIIILSDEKRRIVEINERAEQAYGRGRAELLAMTIPDLRVPGEQNKVDQQYGLAADTGMIFETIHVRADGSTFPVEVSARQILVEGKRYFQSIVRDISERQAAQNALRESAGFIRTVLDNLPIGVAVNSVDPDVTFSYMNDHFPKIYRTSREKLAGPDAFWQAVYQDEEFRNEIRKRVLADCASGDAERMSWSNIPISRPGEETCYVDARNVPIPDKRLMISLVWDVTARNRAETELRESEEKFRQVFEASNVGKSLTLPSGEVAPNKALCDMLGYSLAELQTMRWQDITQKDDIPATERILKLMLGGEQDAARFMKRYVRKDGSLLWADVSVVLRRDPAGKPLNFITTVVDISERMRAEKELQRLNEELEERVRQRTSELSDLYNNAPCGYHSLDADGLFVMVNDTELAWLGYAREEIVGRKKLADVITPESVAKFVAIFPEFKKRGRISNLEFEIRRKDGSTLPVLVSASAIYDADGRYVMSRSTLIDYSEQVRARAAARIQQEKLLAANKELEAFSYSVSHDLRAPLRAIASFGKILEDEYAPRLDVEGRRILEIIIENTGKMGQLIDDLLAFSRLSRQTLAMSCFDPAPLAQEVFAELQAQEKGRKIEFKIGRLTPAFGARSMLRLVLANLLSNALKFTRGRKQARIEFSGRAEKDGNVYFVKDNGVGFDMKYVDKLFGVFQRLHASSEFEGNGVGLAIVQRIVARHGGRVWTEGKVGKGATFYFALPNKRV